MIAKPLPSEVSVPRLCRFVAAPLALLVALGLALAATGCGSDTASGKGRAGSDASRPESTQPPRTPKSSLPPWPPEPAPGPFEDIDPDAIP